MPRLVPGQLIVSPNDHKYEIQRYLGEGVTAEVYAARQVLEERIVALKVLKPNVPDRIAQNFRDEAFTLGELANAQGNTARYLTPRVVEEALSSDIEVQFLAMEFIQGQSLDELIKDAPLDEHTALSIAEQVLHVLDLLHTRLRRSYTDFQMKNIWWQPDTRQVKVMDWNHLSRKAPGNEMPPQAADDLIRFGAYLYQMLTTKGASQLGETGQVLARRGGQAWQELSLGTQYIVRRALHPNPNRRFLTADEFRKEIQKQQKYFSDDFDDIELEAVSALNTVRREIDTSGRYERENLNKAAVLISVLAQRAPGDSQVVRLQQEIDSLTAEVSAEWGSGRSYYNVGAYSEALKRWEAEAEAWGRVDLWRWVMLARMAHELKEEGYRKVKDVLEKTVHSMKNDAWETAENTLKDIQLNGIGGVPLMNLINEVKTHRAAQRAQLAEQMGQWKQAAAAYYDASLFLQQISYRDLLTDKNGEYDYSNLDAKAKYCKQIQQSSVETSQLLEELSQALRKDFTTGLTRLIESFDDIARTEVLVEFCQRQARVVSNLEQQRTLLYTALQYGVSLTASHQVELRQQIAEIEKKQYIQQEEQRQQALLQRLQDLEQILLKDFLTGYQEFQKEWTSSRAVDVPLLAEFTLKQAQVLENTKNIQQACDVLSIATRYFGYLSDSLRQTIQTQLEQAKARLAKQQAEQERHELVQQLETISSQLSIDTQSALSHLKNLWQTPHTDLLLAWYLKQATSNLDELALKLLEQALMPEHSLNRADRDTLQEQKNTVKRELDEKNAEARQKTERDKQEKLLQQGLEQAEQNDFAGLEQTAAGLVNAPPELRESLVQELQSRFDMAISENNRLWAIQLQVPLNVLTPEEAARRQQEIDKIAQYLQAQRQQSLKEMPTIVAQKWRTDGRDDAQALLLLYKEAFAKDEKALEEIQQIQNVMNSLVRVELLLGHFKTALEERNYNRALGTILEAENTLHIIRPTIISSTAHLAKDQFPPLSQRIKSGKNKLNSEMLAYQEELNQLANSAGTALQNENLTEAEGILNELVRRVSALPPGKQSEAQDRARQLMESLVKKKALSLARGGNVGTGGASKLAEELDRKIKRLEPALRTWQRAALILLIAFVMVVGPLAYLTWFNNRSVIAAQDEQSALVTQVAMLEIEKDSLATRVSIPTATPPAPIIITVVMTPTPAPPTEPPPSPTVPVTVPPTPGPPERLRLPISSSFDLPEGPFFDVPDLNIVLGEDWTIIPVTNMSNITATVDITQVLGLQDAASNVWWLQLQTTNTINNEVILYNNIPFSITQVINNNQGIFWGAWSNSGPLPPGEYAAVWQAVDEHKTIYFESEVFNFTVQTALPITIRQEYRRQPYGLTDCKVEIPAGKTIEAVAIGRITTWLSETHDTNGTITRDTELQFVLFRIPGSRKQNWARLNHVSAATGDEPLEQLQDLSGRYEQEYASLRLSDYKCPPSSPSQP